MGSRHRLTESQPLFVRLPRRAAERLESVAAETGATKREVITKLITGDDPVVGAHAFRPGEPNAVLTLPDAAELLRVETAVVEELAEAGQLPGRRVGGEWRFAREALLRWLAAWSATGRR
jgi:excisionase family DNA binding protein